MRIVNAAPTGEGGRPPRPYAEFELGFLTARATAGTAGERLTSMERTLAGLVRRWRATDGLSAGRDIRIAPATLDALTAWVEAGGGIGTAELRRLGVYHSGAVSDAAVPSGWVRVYLDTRHEQREPATVRRQ